mmetsp:Transcript_91291/g.147458  ORF Transcript_91291/g.147458 Transcript_91291/m.147458 type:complete len:82 (-) Transcript_91291:109-354(-)
MSWVPILRMSDHANTHRCALSLSDSEPQPFWTLWVSILRMVCARAGLRHEERNNESKYMASHRGTLELRKKFLTKSLYVGT